MLALSDSQLRTVWAAAERLPIEKRRVLLDRLVAQLQLRGRFTTTDFEDVLRSALSGLIQQSASLIFLTKDDGRRIARWRSISPLR